MPGTGVPHCNDESKVVGQTDDYSNNNNSNNNNNNSLIILNV